jgi:hypothetical protein
MRFRKDLTRATSKTGLGEETSQKNKTNPGLLTDFCNREIFPGSTALPTSNATDLDFYEMVDGTYQRRRQWCFLGEITDYATLHHLEFELTDIDDKKIPLHFYTEDRGREIAPAQIGKGYTVAVLYAQRRAFRNSDPGIRHEDPQKLKACAANPQIQRYFSHHKDLPTLTKEAAGVKRSNPAIIPESRWSQNVTWS